MTTRHSLSLTMAALVLPAVTAAISAAALTQAKPRGLGGTLEPLASAIRWFAASTLAGMLLALAALYRGESSPVLSVSAAALNAALLSICALVLLRWN